MLTLKIRGVGNIASFKNRKRISGDRLVTERGVKKRMQALQHAIEFALLSASTQSTDATSTGAQQPASTLSWPRDDCWTVIPELIVTGELVPPGEEGVDITIERI